MRTKPAKDSAARVGGCNPHGVILIAHEALPGATWGVPSPRAVFDG